MRNWLKKAFPKTAKMWDEPCEFEFPTHGKFFKEFFIIVGVAFFCVVFFCGLAIGWII